MAELSHTNMFDQMSRPNEYKKDNHMSWMTWHKRRTYEVTFETTQSVEA